MGQSLETGNVPKIGLALGGGGARGLAHILMFEAFEEVGLRPSVVSGTSIGAIMGACYCAGCSAKTIRQAVEQMTLMQTDSFDKLVSDKTILKWIEFFQLHFKPGGLLKTDRFIRHLFDRIGVETFEQLKIPLIVVATDLFKREPRLFDTGPLAQAVQASMSIPGVFAPVTVDGAVLVDGQGVNPVPFDVLPADCDLIVAIDVIGQRDEVPGAIPSMADIVLANNQVLQKTIIAEKRRHSPPDIYIETLSTGIEALELHRAETVLNQAAPSKATLKTALEKWLAARPV